MMRNFDDFKERRREHDSIMAQRKKGNSINTNKLKNALKEKSMRSLQAVEAFQEAKARKNMLNKELTKLKDGDMRAVH